MRVVVSLVMASLVLMVPWRASTSGQPLLSVLRILPVGDRITHGVCCSSTDPNRVMAGYRLPLYEAFRRVGVSVDFLGRLSAGPPDLEDTNHEGWDGLGLGYNRDLQAEFPGLENVFPEPYTIANVGLEAVETYQPDVVLLLGGTNDLLQPWTSPEVRASMATRIGTILDGMHTLSPCTRVFYSTIPPVFDTVYPPGVSDADRLAYNTALPDLARTRPWATFVDASADITAADTDGVHPGELAYYRMARAWYDGLGRVYDLPDWPLAAPVPAPTPTLEITPTPPPSGAPLPTLVPGTLFVPAGRIEPPCDNGLVS
jgi:lysophospholipase L1-like esterase